MQKIEKYQKQILGSLGCTTIDEAFSKLGIQIHKSEKSMWKNGVRNLEHPLLRITAANMAADHSQTPATNKKVADLIEKICSSVELSTQRTLKPVEVDNDQRYILRALRASAGLSEAASASYLEAIALLQSDYSHRDISAQKSPHVPSIPTSSVREANTYISEKITARPTLGMINMYLAVHCYQRLFELGIWDSAGGQLSISTKILIQKAQVGMIDHYMYNQLASETGEPTNDHTLSKMWKYLKTDVVAHASQL